MITQNYMLNFIAKAPQPAGVEVKKAESSERSAYPQFKDVLDKTVGRTPGQNTAPRGLEQASQVRNDQGRNDVQDRQAKTFREAVRNDRREVKAERPENDTRVRSTDSSEKNTSEDNSDMKVKPKADAVVESLAQIMGMNPQDLLKLLNSLNIKAEDLVQDSGMNAAVDKLSVVMGLDTQQKQALGEIVKAVVSQVNEVFKQLDTKSANDVQLKADHNTADLKTDRAENRVGWVRLDNVKVEVVEKRPEISELAKLMAGFKLKLGEMTEKLRQNPQQLMNEISAEIQELLAVNETEENQPVQSADAAGEEAGALPGDTVKASQPGNGSETKDAGTGKKEEDAKTEAKAEDGPKKEVTQDLKESNVRKAPLENDGKESVKTNQFNEVMANQTQKSGMANETAKVQKEVHVPKNEIINQVVEKAKVVLNGDKSEMVMDLKPDNLGKLALKVVTERGMVVAKFVAESEQVKAVLEANMQLLKDSLEKQGLSVQGFSVSVGQDRQKGFEQGRETGENTRTVTGRTQAAGERMVQVADMPGSIQKANPYNWSNSRINLTA